MTEKIGERIAKVIARSGVCSRRDAERLILEGKVKVDGKKIISPALNVIASQSIEVNGKLIGAPEETRLWVYNKPTGQLTTHKDPLGRKTVFESLPKTLPRVISIGRLDFNSEGLLLLTNNGELARHIELPATGWTRRYRVRVFGTPTPEHLAKLEKGVSVDGVNYGSIKAEIERDGKSNVWLMVSLNEGKNREIRKVFEFIGFKVSRLIRVAYGPFQLGNLQEGEIKEVPKKVLKAQLGKGFGL